MSVVNASTGSEKITLDIELSSASMPMCIMIDFGDQSKVVVLYRDIRFNNCSSYLSLKNTGASKEVKPGSTNVQLYHEYW